MNRNEYMKEYYARPEVKAKRREKYGAEYQKQRTQQKLIDTYGYENLIQCKICNRWFRQIGTHLVQVHGYDNARQYRKEFGFDLKKGQLPEDYRKLKAELSVGGRQNLIKGRQFWFKKGDEKAGKYTRSPQTLERLKKGTKCLITKPKQ